MAEGHHDLAVKVLQKYDKEMPDIFPFTGVEQSKIRVIDTAYNLHEHGLANKYVSSMDDHITDQLAYNYNLMQSSPGDVNADNVQFDLSVLNTIAQLTKQNQQLALNSKLEAQLNDYANKFSAIIKQ